MNVTQHKFGVIRLARRAAALPHSAFEVGRWGEAPDEPFHSTQGNAAQRKTSAFQGARRAAAPLLLALGLLAPLPGRAHEQLAPVIVDTDMALDDARALALLLNAPEVAVRAIVTSDGACPPGIGATNALRTLRFLGRGDVPVGAGRALGKPAPPWSERSLTLGWSDLPAATNAAVADAASVLRNAFAGSTGTITWFCLGPLSNLADFLRRHPEWKDRIGRVWYYGGLPDADDPGWNTARDPEAARAVFASGLDIVAVQLPDAEVLPFDAALLAQIRKLDSPAAKLIARLHAHPKVQSLVAARHFRAWDETVVLLFHEPGLGRLRPLAPGSPVSALEGFDSEAARALYVNELRPDAAAAGRRPLVTLREFPVVPEQFQPDLEPWVSDIIKRHGVEEWKLIVLTSELHRHLGLYSILGAKMGLRARELLGASLDDLRVESLAGLRPPVSCLNDGLQVATGASLGRGAIHVPETTMPQAAAVFTFGDRRVRLRVRDSAVKKLQADLRAAVQRHGDLTPAYFAEVRRISLEAWRDLDRAQVFEETYEPAPKAGK
jgi:pyrimidine-specific ribonucleoside hydrolase